MSMPRIDEDLTVIEHLDFEPVCDGDGCTGDAKWLAAYHGSKCCCPHEHLYCDVHKKAALSFAEFSVGKVICLFCLQRGQDMVIDRIEPLR